MLFEAEKEMIWLKVIRNYCGVNDGKLNEIHGFKAMYYRGALYTNRSWEEVFRDTGDDTGLQWQFYTDEEFKSKFPYLNEEELKYFMHEIRGKEDILTKGETT